MAMLGIFSQAGLEGLVLAVLSMIVAAIVVFLSVEVQVLVIRFGRLVIAKLYESNEPPAS